MTIRLYVVPMERTPVPPIQIGPKYLSWRADPTPEDQVGSTAHTVITYGQHDWGIAAVEATAAVHTALAAMSDVQQVPANLDNAIANNSVRNTVRSFLEGIGLPGNWVATGTSWREIVRTVCGMMLFGQRYDGIGTDTVPFGQRVQGNLAIQWQNVPQNVRDTAIEAGTTLGYDMGFITPTMVVRNVLKQLADLWGDTPVRFGLRDHNGGETFTV